MNPSLLKIIALLFLVLFGGSFLPAFSGSALLSVVLFLSFPVALSLLIGFRRAWPVAVSAGLLADFAMLGTPGLLAAFSVMSAYVAGFSSRRVVTEHGIVLFVSGGVFVSCATFAFRTVSGLFGAGFSPDTVSVMRVFLIGAVTFPILFVSLRRFLLFADALEPPKTIR